MSPQQTIDAVRDIGQPALFRRMVSATRAASEPPASAPSPALLPARLEGQDHDW